MYYKYKYLETLSLNGKIATKVEKNSCTYLSGILAACDCGDYNSGITSVKEVDGGVNASLVIVPF